MDFGYNYGNNDNNADDLDNIANVRAPARLRLVGRQIEGFRPLIPENLQNQNGVGLNRNVRNMNPNRNARNGIPPNGDPLNRRNPVDRNRNLQDGRIVPNNQNWRRNALNNQQGDGDARPNLQRQGNQQDNNQRAGPFNRDQNARNYQNQNRNNGNQRNNNGIQNRNARNMGFRALEQLSQTEINDIISNINAKRESFIKFISEPMDTDKKDEFVLIMKILSKITLSPFDESKLKLLLEICKTPILGYLSNYLMNLPYAEAETKRRNRFYWNNQTEFWGDFAIFCECLINISPSTALQYCRALIEITSKCCLDMLKVRHGYVTSEEYNNKLDQLRSRLRLCEEEAKVKKEKKPDTDADNLPPDNFRQLNVVPNSEDMFNKRPFLRPNIVNGAYRDVEHYLDVQFRLMREDCFGPLREGLSQYMENPDRKKFDNIRVYRNVQFIKPYVSKSKIGTVIELDKKSIHRFKKTNWAHNKRFIFGSLLLFTKDNCRSFITATILDRDVQMLCKGQMPVSIVSGASDNIFNSGHAYIMIESEVYYEPYYHVLKALQDPTFPAHIAMNKYIINVDPLPNPPKYLNPDGVYTIQTVEPTMNAKFRVLDESTWPSSEEIGLNKSQYDAYKLALTHEFAVIQGPPGTGKTYLGVKVAKTLLENLKSNDQCLMLVICFTNHALDQFLEAIVPITQSIVRIGGQSRNEEMKKLNINNLRLGNKGDINTNRFYHEQRHHLAKSIRDLEQVQGRIENLKKGVISYTNMQAKIPECQIVGRYYERNGIKDPLKHWLFENMHYNEFQNIPIDEDVERNIEHDNEADFHNRIEVILDEFDDVKVDLSEITDEEITTSFSVTTAENTLRNLKALYVRSDMHHRRELEPQIADLQSHLTFFDEMTDNRKREVNIRLNARMDLSRINTNDRWAIYFRWANRIIEDLNENVRPLQETVESASTAYEEARMMLDLKLLKGVKVVGMTTSGAARLRKLLQALAPPIVIVEEAAEVLEQHIVTSLTSRCEHLILIGDHQQLRPSAAHMRLARHYNMEISLFERMINNGMHSRRLGVQHRMRPEFATLICPHIYPELQNHPDVERFPNIRGMTDNLYFLSHNYEENVVEDSASRCNQQEADIALALANYIMQQEYKPEDVTILAAYSGQMFYMRKQRDKYRHLAKVKITVVDNYQGEECKIIILSLVRNNSENKIGFLATDNRVCVALSRAREGFFILGNIDILKKNSNLWVNIATSLDNNASLGNTLLLKCENHPGQISTITSAEDFNKVPEGGCLLKCNYNLPCGHRCLLVCHGYDRGHANIKCYEKCERTNCELNHNCPRLCHEKCDRCKRSVKKELPCGHSQFVMCYVEPTDPAVKCITNVSVILPHCHHEVRKPCYINIKDFKCPERCVYRAECGHDCRLKCHVTDDPDHEQYLCEKPCAKAKKGCTANLEGDRGDHQCQKKCHENCDLCTVEVIKKRSTCKHPQRVRCHFDINEIPCPKNCARALQCGHFCKKKCYEPCGDCKEKVKKPIPDCSHEVMMLCMEEPTRERCDRACERLMSCGHYCKEKCNKICDPAKCTALIERMFRAPCGHAIMLPCNIYRETGGDVSPELLLNYCREPCTKELECSHMCGGTCSECHQGRLHVACKEACHRPNICGHHCGEPCNQVCPPCNLKCEIKCRHSRCNKLCGVPCVPCQEKCTRVCPHGACEKRCSEPCSRKPCDEKCKKTLKCGHPCRGLCGEPCPNICKICRPDEFPTGFIGEEYEDDDKFIKLEDCSHFLEVDTMDTLMLADRESIVIRTCPFCRKPIINTHRYKDVVNSMIKLEINPVKQRIFGNEAMIKLRTDELFRKFEDFLMTHVLILNGNQYLNNFFYQLHKIVTKNQKKMSLLKLEMHFQCLEIIDMMTECYVKYETAKLSELRNELMAAMKTITNHLMININKISEQVQIDTKNEMKRLNYIVQLAKIFGHPSYQASKNVSKVQLTAESAKNVVLYWGVFNENETLKALSTLQETVNVLGIVSKEERDLVVKAINSKLGSWYKCPNGHFYCIDRCGGAMEVSKCADCGVPIGGTSHTLLANNDHAGEVDGSRHSAWPGAQMDMRNFQL